MARPHAPRTVEPGDAALDLGRDLALLGDVVHDCGRHQGAGGGVDDRLAAGERRVAVAAVKDVIVGREPVDPAELERLTADLDRDDPAAGGLLAFSGRSCRRPGRSARRYPQQIGAGELDQRCRTSVVEQIATDS